MLARLALHGTHAYPVQIVYVDNDAPAFSRSSWPYAMLLSAVGNHFVVVAWIWITGSDAVQDSKGLGVDQLGLFIGSEY